MLRQDIVAGTDATLGCFKQNSFCEVVSQSNPAFNNSLDYVNIPCVSAEWKGTIIWWLM